MTTRRSQMIISLKKKVIFCERVLIQRRNTYLLKTSDEMIPFHNLAMS